VDGKKQSKKGERWNWETIPKPISLFQDKNWVSHLLVARARRVREKKKRKQDLTVGAPGSKIKNRGGKVTFTTRPSANVPRKEKGSISINE